MEKQRITCRYLLGERMTVIATGRAWGERTDSTFTLPLDWPVYNATRPLPGSYTWQDMHGPCCGWFYATVDPATDQAAQLTEAIRRLDARRLVWVTPAQVVQALQAYYDHEYPADSLNVAAFDPEEQWDAFWVKADKEDFWPYLELAKIPY